MSEVEYPRWVHAPGRKSIVVETPEDKDSFLAAATAGREADAPVPVAPSAPQLVAPQRFNHVSFQGMRDGEIGGYEDAPEPDGKWVRWNDVAALFGGNLLTDAPTLDASVAAVAPPPKRTGGWPKGKPRSPKDASVN